MDGTVLMLLIGLVAFAYAMVGHGGASGYLALLAIVGMSVPMAKSSALIINLFVSGISFAQYARAGHFWWRVFWPFALASVPMAWLGAGIDIEPLLYKRILAVCLLLAVLRMFGFFGKGGEAERAAPLPLALMIGAVLGLVSGMIGIGGGILLSPVLLLLRYADTKVTACTSALFILVNSAAGLAGTSELGAVLTPTLAAWVAAALIGGLAGAYIGAIMLQPVRLRQALGVVLLLACFKLWLP
ncbi:MAG: sulfite exporter TauE/SafE family protein [Flavobacteriales bacterium]|nr:sulfite exporter TauE/SafE family protein [Flavobacteriales bacterium]